MDISFVVNAHREALLLHAALESAVRAVRCCQEDGITSEILLVVDKPDEETRRVSGAWRASLRQIAYVDYGNLGHSRMHGVRLATGRFVCFLDGDDLWQPEWPRLAYRYAQREADHANCIYHTEIFAEFGQECSLRKQIGTDDLIFHPNYMVAAWQFCNNLFAHSSIFEEYPIQPYDHSRGLGPEDWHWSCETCYAGISRRVVPGTVYFYRRRGQGNGLGSSPWLVLPKTALFCRDGRVSEYGSHFGVAPVPESLLRELNSSKWSLPVPNWLAAATSAASEIDYDVWGLRQKLPSLTVESPRMYVALALAFGEVRRLYDECGRFGVVFLKSYGRGAGGLATLLRTVSSAARKQPLIVALDRPVHPQYPIYRHGDVLFIDISLIFEVDGAVAYSLRQLFMSVIVQLEPIFCLCVGHWIGEALSPYRATIKQLGIRFGYVGTTFRESLDADEPEWRRLLARIQGGTAWYSEIWLGADAGWVDEFIQLERYGGTSLHILVGRGIGEVLSAAINAPGETLVQNDACPLPHVACCGVETPIPDVSCLLNVHREREILIPTLCSISRMRQFASERNLSTELVIICDDPDDDTRSIVARFLRSGSPLDRAIEVKHGNLAHSRNAGIAEARGSFICLLDGDDLYSKNWITGAIEVLENCRSFTTAVHPALSVYFGRERRHFWHPEWDPTAATSAGVLFENYWTSLSFGRAELYRQIPFATVNLGNGSGFEDWHWNLQVIASGGTHIVADHTCHFIRLKENGSLNQLSADTQCRIPPSPLVRTLLHS